jgi:anti-sigma factor RsiW
VTGRRSPGASPAQDCRARLAQLFAYLDGELSPSACRALERHLAGCECCEALTESLRQAIAGCRAAGRARLPADVSARARRRVRDLLKQEPQGNRRGTKRARSHARD